MDVYWLEQKLGDVPPVDRWLSGSERVRSNSLHIPKRRADWRLGRWTAKCAVTEYLNLPRDPEAFAAIELRPAPSGAPEVFSDGRPALVALSLSHSRGCGLCAVAPAGAEVGCDLEAVEPRSPAFLADYFAAEEQELVARSPAGRRDQVLTLLWTAKESVLKALHCGLRSDTRSVNAAPADFLRARDGEWHRITAEHVSGRTFYGWWRESRGLIRTVVAAPPSRRPKLLSGCVLPTREQVYNHGAETPFSDIPGSNYPVLSARRFPHGNLPQTVGRSRVGRYRLRPA
jgi:4'-phosphopantetheinyl transferase